METKQVTVAGKIFSMPCPFEEGHELTAGEASQLNQVYHENARNNKAKAVREAVEAGKFDQADFQGQFDKYFETYEFGERKSGGPRAPSDPVAKEALKIALEAIKSHLRSQGKKPSDYKTESLNTLAAALVAKRPDITESAREVVAKRSAVATDGLASLMGGLEAKPAEPVAQAAE